MLNAGLWKYAAGVKTSWGVVALVIASILAAYDKMVTKPNAHTRKALWPVVSVLFLLGMLAIIAEPIAKNMQSKELAIYRVRVTVVDGNNVPVDEANVRTTVANESKTSQDGSAELAIPKGSLPKDGRITVFADKEAAFLHGSREVTLGDDVNVSITIPVIANESAEVKGSIQDEAGYAIPQAVVSVAEGQAVRTDANGNFQLPAYAARGQKVRIHAEKAGYTAVDQYEPAGEMQTLIVLTLEKHLH